MCLFKKWWNCCKNSELYCSLINFILPSFVALNANRFIIMKIGSLVASRRSKFGWFSQKLIPQKILTAWPIRHIPRNSLTGLIHLSDPESTLVELPFAPVQFVKNSQWQLLDITTASGIVNLSKTSSWIKKAYKKNLGMDVLKSSDIHLPGI